VREGNSVYVRPFEQRRAWRAEHLPHRPGARARHAGSPGRVLRQVVAGAGSLAT
jgi:hypothetical protein